jgi:hypothetical protein
MTRIVSLALLAAGSAWGGVPHGDVAVAPPPREVRPDGTRVPPPESNPQEDPREIVGRIIKNSKTVGDKLAMTDTGADTLKTQDKILKDIDALLNPDDPPNSGQDQDDKKDKQDPMGNKDKKDDHPKDDKDDMGPMPKGGDMQPKNDAGMPDMMPPPGGMPMGGMSPAGMSGAEEQPKGRRPRQQQGGRKDEGMDKKDSGGGGNPPKNGHEPAGGAKDPASAGGKMPNPDNNPKSPPGPPSLPWEEEVVRDVWGHLPDKLRQQATQFYKQDVLPRYAELLKHYYASLAEKGEKK